MTFISFLVLLFGKPHSMDKWSMYFIGSMAFDAFMLGLVLYIYIARGGAL